MTKGLLKRSLQRAAILTATAKKKNITRGLITCFLTLSVPLALTLPGDVYAAHKEQGASKCSDGIDNDNDGFIDCNDDECFSQSFCQVTTTTGATTTTTTTATHNNNNNNNCNANDNNNGNANDNDDNIYLNHDHNNVGNDHDHRRVNHDDHAAAAIRRGAVQVKMHHVPR